MADNLNTPDTDFDRLGSNLLRQIISEFIDEMRRDIMIGYLFSHVDPFILKAREYEFAARSLGASPEDVVYKGRPIKKAHAHVSIMGGHFDRRTQILKGVLHRHGVPRDIESRWQKHIESLRSSVTGMAVSECL